MLVDSHLLREQKPLQYVNEPRKSRLSDVAFELPLRALEQKVENPGELHKSRC